MPDRRPELDEHAPHHSRYIDVVPSPVLDALRKQREDVPRMLAGIDDRTAEHRYEPEKWTVREVIGHLSDAERIYGYRALAIAREDGSALPPYDPDAYVPLARYEQRSIASLLDEFVAVRDSTLALFTHLPLEAWSRRGAMGGNPLSVRALAFIAAGHVTTHLAVLRDRYGLRQIVLD